MNPEEESVVLTKKRAIRHTVEHQGHDRLRMANCGLKTCHPQLTIRNPQWSVALFGTISSLINPSHPTGSELDCGDR